MTAHFEYLRYRVYWRELRKEQRNPAYRTPEFETRFYYPSAAILIYDRRANGLRQRKAQTLMGPHKMGRVC